MKVLSGFLLLISVLFTGQLFAHEEPAKTLREKQEKEKQRLEIKERNIRSVTVFKYQITDGKPDSTSKSKFYITYYDSSGTISGMNVFKSGDSLDYRIEFTYDQNNNMMTDTDFDSEGKMAEQIKYTYDSNHRVINQINYKGDRVVDSRFIYEMKPDTRTVLFTKVLPSDSVEYQIIYRYPGHPDSTNATNIIKQKPDGTLLLRVENEYNADGIRLRKKIFNEKNDLQYFFEYSYYPENGKFKTITKKSSDLSVLSTTAYSINTTGLTESVETRDSNGRLTAWSEYEYVFNR